MDLDPDPVQDCIGFRVRFVKTRPLIRPCHEKLFIQDPAQNLEHIVSEKMIKLQIKHCLAVLDMAREFESIILQI